MTASRKELTTAAQGVLDRILGDEDVDSLGAALVGAKEEVGEALRAHIGNLFVENREEAAAAVRQALWQFETVCDVAGRVLDEQRALNDG